MPKYYLFRCTGYTYKECLTKGLFGASAGMINLVRNVQVGDILYLNFLPNVHDTRIFIEGPFKAISTVGNYDPTAWGGRFTSQIKVETSGERKIVAYPDYVSLFGRPNSGSYSYDFILMDQIKGEKLTNAIGIEDIKEQAADIFDIKNFRKKWPNEFRAEDGHFVRSLSETLIDNWLYYNGYLHSYEKRLPIKENAICDFHLKTEDIYIEFWGMKNEEQIKRREQKVQIYKDNNLKLLNLDIEDIADIDTKLPEKIRVIKEAK